MTRDTAEGIEKLTEPPTVEHPAGTFKRQMIVRYPEDWNDAQVQNLFNALSTFMKQQTPGIALPASVEFEWVQEKEVYVPGVDEILVYKVTKK